ncbi:MAG: hypothetical protein JHC93_04200 [Parachlamydiales bacterium]|nr:hypothetical protein [Parachlamydiales bacterium]
MSFFVQWQNIYMVPVLHYTMESASFVKMAFDEITPDCVAVELAETMESQLKDAVARLPDISVVISGDTDPTYYLIEPCDAAFEGIRLALENGIGAYCIDLDVDAAPRGGLSVPDPYSMARIGLKAYYDSYRIFADQLPQDPLNKKREEHMARRLKDLSLQYDKVLFVGGMDHIHRLKLLLDNQIFATHTHHERSEIKVCTLTDESCRQVMAESGYMSTFYEIWRSKPRQTLIDRHTLNYIMLKEAAATYTKEMGHAFETYHVRNILKFARNMAFMRHQLLPNLMQLLTSAKSCVDSNYAYELWLLATTYMHLKNIDGLLELDLSVEEVWGQSSRIQFRLKEKSRKSTQFKKRKNPNFLKFRAFNPYAVCSYPKEDLRIESFAQYVKKRGETLVQDETSRSMPFATSLEDGIDTKETIRHWHEKKIYVKVRGKPQGMAGSVVIIFNEDSSYSEKYPWKLTWQGENNQESDMAFYSTDRFDKIVGPGITRCEYGGMMMSFPPGRMYDVWSDPDYQNCRTKAEILLMAAIDYAISSLIVYVADTPPRSYYKSYANRFGKKIIYLPLSQFSSVMLNQLRLFHVLDGHDRRAIADDYIF